MGQNGRVALFLADEQALFRQGLVHQLSLYPDLDIVGEAASGEEALAALQGLPPCVMVVCSLSLTPFQGLVRKVRRQLPAGLVLAVSDVKDPEAIFQAASSGAEAVLPRAAGPESWAQTIREVHRGSHPIDLDLTGDPQVARRLLDQFEALFSCQGLAAILIPLSPQEESVLNGLTLGMALTEVEASLQLTPKDLHRHLTSIRCKMESNTAAQEAVLAIWGDTQERK